FANVGFNARPAGFAGVRADAVWQLGRRGLVARQRRKALLMLLALRIVSEQGAALGSTAYKVFDERGGSIGRITGNDWVLPDPQHFVSSRHALVRSAGRGVYLADRSSNATFINAPDQLTARGEPQALSDGDRLFIGDYEIIV